MPLELHGRGIWQAQCPAGTPITQVAQRYALLRREVYNLVIGAGH